MPILRAELQIAGRQVACDQVSYSFLQSTDEQGRPSSVVRTGLLEVIISGEAAGWSLWEEIKFDDFRRESGHVVFFQSEYTSTRRYTFYDAALIHLEFRHDGRGTTNRQAATEVELHFSAATIEVHGIRLENYSLIPWKTDAATSFRALTPPPAPSPHLAAGAGLLATAQLKVEEAATGLLKKVITPAGEVGTEIAGLSLGAIGRVAGLLPALLLAPVNSNADLSKDGDWQLYRRNNSHPDWESNTHPPIPPPPKADELRLAELERALANQTLDAQQEAELIVLLAKVMGIHIQRLDDLRTLPSRPPNPNAKPGGLRAKIDPRDELEKQQALLRENETADIMAQAGYNVEQNPVSPNPPKKPDYRIEGKIFDNYAPTSSNSRNIWSNTKTKVVEEQTKRVILNLRGSGVDTAALTE